MRAVSVNLNEWVPYVGLLIAVLLYVFRRDTTVANAEKLVNMSVNTQKGLEARIDKLTERQDVLEADGRVKGRWIELLCVQVRGCGGTPASYEDAAEDVGVPLSVFKETFSDVRSEIAHAFDDSEFRMLARDVGFNPDDIRGTTLTEHVAELLEMAQRQGKTRKLREEIKKARPKFPKDLLASIK